MNLDLNFTPLTKINSRQITNLKVKGKTIKLLEENIRKYLHDLHTSKDF